MKLNTYFKDFLHEIRLTDDQVTDLKNEHEKLRGLLKEDDELSDIIVHTFLQGSYRRSTIIKPKNDNNPDVDVVVVTRLDKNKYTPAEALHMFEPFLEENYENNYRIQGRSLGINLDIVDLDLVVTAAPSEIDENIIQKSGILFDLTIEDIKQTDKTYRSKGRYESAEKIINFVEKSKNTPEWKTEPLYIPDRNANEWQPTHPLEQILWTFEKNDKTNGHYVNIVKALKWWRQEKFPDADHPKSYPLEHFIGYCCPNGIKSVAEGITSTLETIKFDHENKPELPDHGVPEHDVFSRITDEEYEEFYSQVTEAAELAREALDSDDKKESIKKWRNLFGKKFPPYKINTDIKRGGYSKRTKKTSNIPGGKFA
ncbi:MAG: nucleotidyltransferase [Methanobacterium sp. BRmetb2]|nr:MAG: nucleotidyltransferase [Methanobacterium sp. BRmetb2]